MDESRVSSEKGKRVRHLASRVAHLADVLASPDFPTGDRAVLKRQQATDMPSLRFVRFAERHLPPDWHLNRQEWAAVVSGIALMSPHAHDQRRSFGAVLSEQRFSESRLERLLAATGETLTTLVMRAIRFLAAKNQTCNWNDVAYLLGLGGDSAHTRLSIARDYYRHQDTKNRKE